MKSVIDMKGIQRALIVLIATTLPALAHHSVAGYDSKQTSKVSGTVKEFHWKNPHIFVYIDVLGAQGAATEWIFECGAPAINTRLGWKPTDIKKGDKITVEYNPAMDGRNDGLGRYIWLADGQQRSCVGALVGVGGPGAPGELPPGGAPGGARN